MLVRCYVYDCKHNRDGRCKLDYVRIVDFGCFNYEKSEGRNEFKEKFEKMLDELKL